MRKYVLLMIFAQLLASVSQLLLKKAALKYGDDDPEAGKKRLMGLVRQYLNFLVIAGYVLLMVSMLLSIICYGGMPYMYVVIIEPVSYIMVMLLSRVFFKERLTGRKLFGMGLILTGILVFYV